MQATVSRVNSEKIVNLKKQSNEFKTPDEVFRTLSLVDVSQHVETKNGLNYLSWAWAWAYVKSIFGSASYKIKPYVYDPNLGYMVFTEVTIENVTHEMWLPVMDSQNRAMKNAPYEIQTKYKTIAVLPATMMDINKSYMRCLVKNLAMFGLGINLYAGEDINDILPVESVVLPDDLKNKISQYEAAYQAAKRNNPNVTAPTLTDYLYSVCGVKVLTGNNIPQLTNTLNSFVNYARRYGLC